MLGVQLVRLLWKGLGDIVLLEKATLGMDFGVSKDHARQAKAAFLCLSVGISLPLSLFLSLFVCLMPVVHELTLSYCSSVMLACLLPCSPP